MAGAVAYLASPLSGSTSGTSLAIDGGMQGLRLRLLRLSLVGAQPRAATCSPMLNSR